MGVGQCFRAPSGEEGGGSRQQFISSSSLDLSDVFLSE